MCVRHKVSPSKIGEILHLRGHVFKLNQRLVMNVLVWGGEPVTWLVVMQQVQHGGVQVKACSMTLGEAQHITTTNKLLTVTIESNRPAHTSIHLKDAQRLCWISVQVRVAIGGWKRWWAAPLSEADYTSPPSWAAAECRPGRVAIRTHLCFEASWVCDTEIIKHTHRGEQEDHHAVSAFMCVQQWKILISISNTEALIDTLH